MKSKASSSSTASVPINPNRRRCKCNQWAVVQTTWKQPNAGKRFLGCPNFDKERGIRGCGYFKWYKDEDEPEDSNAMSEMDVTDLAAEFEMVCESNKELSDMYDQLKKDNRNLVSMVELVNEENKLLKMKASGEVGVTVKKMKKSGGGSSEALVKVESEKRMWQLALFVVVLGFIVSKVF